MVNINNSNYSPSFGMAYTKELTKLKPHTQKYVEELIGCSHDKLKEVTRGAIVDIKAVSQDMIQLTARSMNESVCSTNKQRAQTAKEIFLSGIFKNRKDSNYKLIPTYKFSVNEFTECAREVVEGAFKKFGRPNEKDIQKGNTFLRLMYPNTSVLDDVQLDTELLKNLSGLMLNNHK